MERRYQFGFDEKKEIRLCFMNGKPFLFHSCKAQLHNYIDEVLEFFSKHGLENPPSEYVDLLAYANGGLMIGYVSPGPADWSGFRKPIVYRAMEAPIPPGFGESTAKIIFYSFIREEEINRGVLSIGNRGPEVAKGLLEFARDADNPNQKYFLDFGGLIGPIGSVIVFDEESGRKEIVSASFSAFIDSFFLDEQRIRTRQKPRNIINLIIVSTLKSGPDIKDLLPETIFENNEALFKSACLLVSILVSCLVRRCQESEDAEESCYHKILNLISPENFEIPRLDEAASFEVVNIFCDQRKVGISDFVSLHCSVSKETAHRLLNLLACRIAYEFRGDFRNKNLPSFRALLEAQENHLNVYLNSNEELSAILQKYEGAQGV